MNQKFKISKIEFENWKNFSKKQVIDFRASSSVLHDTDLYEEKWNSKFSSNFLPVIAIYGANSSGKTNILEVFKLYKSFIEWPKYRDNLSDFFKINFFNNPKKEIVISLYYETKQFDFKHTLIFKNNKKNITPSDKVGFYPTWKETIELTRKGTSIEKKEIFNSETLNATFLEVYNFLLINKKKKNQEFDDIKFAIFSSYLKDEFLGDIFVILQNIDLSLNIDITKYMQSNRIPGFGKPSDLEFMSGFLIDRVLTALISYYQIDSLTEKVEAILEIIDKNFSKAYLVQQDDGFVRLQATKIKNSEAVFGWTSGLSDGTVFFLFKVLSTLLYAKIGEGKHIYIFADELGNAWHTALTKKFISLFKKGIIENATLVFTTHDANIGDLLRKDSIYVINQENQILKVDNNKEVKRNLFSKNYNNESEDAFEAFPSFDNLSNLIDIFNE